MGRRPWRDLADGIASGQNFLGTRTRNDPSVLLSAIRMHQTGAFLLITLLTHGAKKFSGPDLTCIRRGMEA